MCCNSSRIFERVKTVRIISILCYILSQRAFPLYDDVQAHHAHATPSLPVAALSLCGPVVEYSLDLEVMLET